MSYFHEALSKSGGKGNSLIEIGRDQMAQSSFAYGGELLNPLANEKPWRVFSRRDLLRYLHDNSSHGVKNRQQAQGYGGQVGQVTNQLGKK